MWFLTIDTIDSSTDGNQVSAMYGRIINYLGKQCNVYPVDFSSYLTDKCQAKGQQLYR